MSIQFPCEVCGKMIWKGWFTPGVAGHGIWGTPNKIKCGACSNPPREEEPAPFASLNAPKAETNDDLIVRDKMAKAMLEKLGDELLAQMQEPGFSEAMAKAFRATPQEIGQAALENYRKRTSTAIKLCPNCPTGHIVLMCKAKRTSEYKGRTLPIPFTLKIPTCTVCGGEWVDLQTAEKLDQALEAEYQRQFPTI